ncbi:MAG: DUF3825 domain-containing protein [Anaerovoracaceae bacterium]
MRYCKYCGKPLKDDYKFCMECGHLVDDWIERPDPMHQEAKNDLSIRHAVGYDAAQYSGTHNQTEKDLTKTKERKKENTGNKISETQDTFVSKDENRLKGNPSSSTGNTDNAGDMDDRKNITAEERKRKEKAKQEKGKKKQEHIVCAVCTRKGKEKISFRSNEGRYFAQSVKYLEDKNEDIQKGDIAWFSKINEYKYHYLGKTIINNPKNSGWHLSREAESFENTYHEGDIINLPVIKNSRNSLQIALGQVLYTFINAEELPEGKDFFGMECGKLYPFEVKSITKNKKGNLKVKLLPAEISEDNLYSQLPESLSDIPISDMTVNRIRKSAGAKTLETIFGGEITAQKIRKYVEKEYQKQKNEKTLVFRKRKEQLRIDVDMEARDQNNAMLKAMVTQNANRKEPYLSYIGVVSPGPEIERYVYIPSWDHVTKVLAEIALPEDWGEYNGIEDRPILAHYLRLAFYKALLDDLLVVENGEAIFNTGLVDKSYDAIYCYLKKNTSSGPFSYKRWMIGYFACRGKGRDGKDLNRKFTNFPEPPKYINPERLGDVFFDTSKDLYCDYEHIIEDNFNRIPLEFVKNCLTGPDKEVRNLFIQLESDPQNGHLIKTIHDYVLNSPDLKRILEDNLETAVKTAVKYCRWNYKTAVPIYYPKINNISLLLPLQLLQTGVADLALVVERLENGNYQGQTILTLSMAYNDARQICRPNSEWLTSDLFSSDEDEDDSEENEENNDDELD